MSEPNPQAPFEKAPANQHPPVGELPPSGTPQTPVAGPRPRRRSRVVLVAVVAIALLVGAGATAAVPVVSDRFGTPRHEYRVSVFLDHEITAEQKAAVESALAGLHPVDGITFESREQAWERFQEMFEDRPDLVNGTKPEHLPESFHLTTTGTEFDCAVLAPVRRLPGVGEVTVVQPAMDGRPGAVVACT